MNTGKWISRAAAIFGIGAVLVFGNCKNAEEELKKQCGKLSDGEVFEEVGSDGVSVISKFDKGVYVFDVENKTKKKAESKINWISPCTVQLQWPNGAVEEMKFLSYKDNAFQYDQSTKADNLPVTKKDGENPESKCDFFKSGQFDVDRKSVNAGPAILEITGETLTLKDAGSPQVFGTWSIKWEESECIGKGKIVQHIDARVVGQNTRFTFSDIKGKTAVLQLSGYSSGQVKLVKSN